MPVILTELTDDSAPSPESYDGFLLVSFGGPEGPEDVMPFLENVLRGKNVPHERMLEVAEHYQKFGGKEPDQRSESRIDARIASREFRDAGIMLPVYWGNRNWTPTIADALLRMRDDGVKNVLAFFTSMFSSYSGCRQYRENIADAQKQMGDLAPTVVRLRLGFNHPGFIEAVTDHLRDALSKFPESDRASVPVLFTAHSIPHSMAENCGYVAQLQEASRLVAERVGTQNWELCYQSRSGPPQVPWLEPDICDRIESLHGHYVDKGETLDRLVVVPIGFVSDHMEVIYDLDDEAAKLCQRLGIEMRRAATAGNASQLYSYDSPTCRRTHGPKRLQEQPSATCLHATTSVRRTAAPTRRDGRRWLEHKYPSIRIEIKSNQFQSNHAPDVNIRLTIDCLLGDGTISRIQVGIHSVLSTSVANEEPYHATSTLPRMSEAIED
ncbi:MAG: ferrochelatase [Pirellulaceae bacterium]